MKKLKLIILVIVLISSLFILSGCTNSIASWKDIEIYENENFKAIRNNLTKENKSNISMPITVVIDKSTKVMYLDGRPMINAEGKPLLYEGD